MMKFSVLMMVAMGAALAGAADYHYVGQDQFKQWLEGAKPVVIVDIQPAAEFEKHHFRGAIETNAYPAKAQEERQRLDKAVSRIASTSDDVVIVCPRGGGGAKNTYEYFKQRGMDEKRLFILEKGMAGWPYPKLSVSGH